MSVGSAGVRRGNAIASKPNEIRHFAFGPYLTLSPGKYLARVRVAIVRSRTGQESRRALSIELVLDEEGRQTFDAPLDSVGKRALQFSFDISKEDAVRPIQIRLTSYDAATIILNSIWVERIDSGGDSLKTWLPMRFQPNQLRPNEIKREFQ